eukprot:TRINITY_DN62859_c0_g1_i1.p1 TRINITY_DN62859_c0_g1~~TRINITY_DN62859_c0_g1_i1.p1  ORF type:complete len:117 (-),score=13.25 TRINITY_DN62859_c0_g1_i1:297-647(-)
MLHTKRGKSMSCVRARDMLQSLPTLPELAESEPHTEENASESEMSASSSSSSGSEACTPRRRETRNVERRTLSSSRRRVRRTKQSHYEQMCFERFAARSENWFHPEESCKHDLISL